jgi:replication-associated recombination protein RarA
MKKLIYFLTNWHTWHATPLSNKRKRTTTVASSDPSKFKAVLLTGPPGVGKDKNLFIRKRKFYLGKTTTAQLVCQALNMPYTEQNASDNRSQTTMEKLELNSAYLTDENQTMTKHV